MGSPFNSPFPGVYYSKWKKDQNVAGIRKVSYMHDFFDRKLDKQYTPNSVYIIDENGNQKVMPIDDLIEDSVQKSIEEIMKKDAPADGRQYTRQDKQWEEGISALIVDYQSEQVYEFSINPTPGDAEVTLSADGYTQIDNKIYVKKGTTVVWTVKKDNFIEQTGIQVVNETTSLNITLYNFSKSYGQFSKLISRIGLNPTRDDWLYTLSLHFSSGILPLIIGKDEGSITIDRSLYLENAEDSLNSAYYLEETGWINSFVIETTSGFFNWYNSDNERIGSLSHDDAYNMNWNNGNLTVVDTAFTSSISDDGKTLVIKKNGVMIVKYTIEP